MVVEVVEEVEEVEVQKKNKKKTAQAELDNALRAYLLNLYNGYGNIDFPFSVPFFCIS